MNTNTFWKHKIHQVEKRVSLHEARKEATSLIERQSFTELRVIWAIAEELGVAESPNQLSHPDSSE